MVQNTMPDLDCVEYSNEWSIDELDYWINRTPSFSPLLGYDLSFCFKICCEFCFNIDGSPPDNKLTLVKLRGSEIPEILRVDVNGSVMADDGKVHSFKSMSSIKVHQMTEVAFPFTCSSINFIKCSMRFFYDTSKPLQLKPWQESVCNCDSHKLFANDINSLYNTGLFSDVKVIVGEHTLSAHKFILAAHSPVFKRMVTGDFKESHTNVITIKDSSYEVFSVFLKYLYSGEISDSSWLNVRELYVLADKYDVAVLKRQCRQRIPTFLGTDTVCDILILAFTYEDADLKEAAVEFAFAHIKNIKESDRWIALAKSHSHIAYEVMSKFLS